MEEDIFYDDILNQGKTDKNGYFSLYGKDEEFTVIEPYIKINYSCPIKNETNLGNIIFLYLPITALNSYKHYSEYSHNFGNIDLYKLLT
ncbi:Transthyretin-like family-containing protein [Strongyloides ratti]|uniref:Transthyretin-like family-containing protein n=1 Tax=Strongyloides ratti TaxID=34506 RepID=A0A090MZ74_STRRB|nr:Transthyretin-like family-containing protein [Strongyloides ratti]CEF68439.1 Transthyretin-like family-containing protein [Strongyloides ratti]